MNDGWEENQKRSSEKHLFNTTTKRSSKDERVKLSKLRKIKQRNDNLLDEFRPLLSVEHGFDEGACNGELTKIRQRSTKSFAVIECDVENNSNEIDCSFELEKEERSKDDFLLNDFLLLEIKDGDTLQSISLQYHCPVSDLKRANNLISNQEFYALRHLRIPVKKFSLLTERLPLAPKISETGHSSIENGFGVRTVSVGIGPTSPGSSQEESAEFFRRMDEDLVKIMNSTKSKKETLEAATFALTSPSIQPLVNNKVHVGVDCGMKWRHLVTIAILVGLILPVVVVIYLYTHHNESDLTPQHVDITEKDS